MKPPATANYVLMKFPAMQDTITYLSGPEDNRQMTFDFQHVDSHGPWYVPLP